MTPGRHEPLQDRDRALPRDRGPLEQGQVRARVRRLRRPGGRRSAGTASSGSGRQKIFEVRKVYNDVTFIDAFLNEEFCERLKLYVYGYDSRAGRHVIVSRDWRKVKERLLFSLTNLGQPIVHVVGVEPRQPGRALPQAPLRGRPPRHREGQGHAQEPPPSLAAARAPGDDGGGTGEACSPTTAASTSRRGFTRRTERGLQCHRLGPDVFAPLLLGPPRTPLHDRIGAGEIPERRPRPRRGRGRGRLYLSRPSPGALAECRARPRIEYEWKSSAAALVAAAAAAAMAFAAAKDGPAQVRRWPRFAAALAVFGAHRLVYRVDAVADAPPYKRTILGTTRIPWRASPAWMPPPGHFTAVADTTAIRIGTATTQRRRAGRERAHGRPPPERSGRLPRRARADRRRSRTR